MGLTCRSPLATFTSTMKNTMSITMSRRGTSLVEVNMFWKTATSTMIGIALSAIASGETSSLSRLERMRAKLAATPRPIPRSRPTRALPPETKAAARTSPTLSVKADQMAVGAGRK